MTEPRDPGSDRADADTGSGYVAPPPFVRPGEFGSPQPGYGTPSYETTGYQTPSYQTPSYAQPGSPFAGQARYGYPSPYAVPPGYVLVPGYYPPPKPRLAFGVLACSLTALGTLLLLVSLLGLAWFSGADGGLTTSDVRTSLSVAGEVANGLSVSYFSWLSWALLVLSAGSAVAAAIPVSGLSLAFRITAPIVAWSAVLVSFAAIELTEPSYADNAAYSRYFSHLTWGFWLAIIGFVLIGAGGIVGPRRLKD